MHWAAFDASATLDASATASPPAATDDYTADLAWRAQTILAPCERRYSDPERASESAFAKCSTPGLSAASDSQTSDAVVGECRHEL